jgi:soluble lytic murein transglycosylase-like protein
MRTVSWINVKNLRSTVVSLALGLATLCVPIRLAHPVPPRVSPTKSSLNIPVDIVEAVAYVESRNNYKAIGDGGKAYGLMQIHCPTAKDVGFEGGCKGLFNPDTNIYYATKYLEFLFNRYGSLYKALDAYNRGLGNVDKWPYKGDYKKHKYVGKVMSALGKIILDRENKVWYNIHIINYKGDKDVR